MKLPYGKKGISPVLSVAVKHKELQYDIKLNSGNYGGS